MKTRALLLSLCLSLTPAFAKQAPVVSKTLSNGLEIRIQTNHRAPVVLTQVWYRVGSAQEHLGITGISHLLEHMMFQGTKQYGPGKLTKLVAREGGQQNAATTADFTFYYQYMPKSGFDLSLKLEADRMHGLILDQKLLTKELEVVKEERRMRTEDKPGSKLYERFLAAAHIATPYHHPVVGWMSDLNQITHHDVVNWYQRWYCPGNAVLVIAGDVNPKSAIKKATAAFGKIPPCAQHPAAKHFSTLPGIGIRELDAHLPAKQAVIILGWNVPSLLTAKTTWHPYALAILADAMSRGKAGRLPKRLFLERKLSSEISTSYTMLARFGSLLQIVTTPRKNVDPDVLRDEIIDAVETFKTELVSMAELKRIQSGMLSGRVFGLDSLVEQASQIGQLETLELGWKKRDEWIKQAMKITPKQIQTVAKLYLKEGRLTVATLYPEDIPKGQTLKPTQPTTLSAGAVK